MKARFTAFAVAAASTLSLIAAPAFASPLPEHHRAVAHHGVPHAHMAAGWHHRVMRHQEHLNLAGKNHPASMERHHDQHESEHREAHRPQQFHH